MVLFSTAILLAFVLQGVNLSAQEAYPDLDKFLMNLSKYRSDLLIKIQKNSPV